MSFNRRAFLLGSCVSALSASLPAFAQDPATIATAAAAAGSLVSNVLDFFKQSGEFENRLQELNVKLDQALRNQLLLIEAIGDLAEDVKAVSEAVGRTPDETLTAFLLNDAASLVNRLADTINDHGNVLQYVDQAYVLSTKIAPAAQAADRPPNLALAAANILNAVETIMKHVPQIHRATRTHLSNTCTYVRDTLERMTAKEGIQARIPNPDSIDAAIKGLANANGPLKLLPQDFSSISAKPPQNDTWSAALCVMGGDREQVLSRYNGHCHHPLAVNMDAPEWCDPPGSEINIAIQLIKPKFQIERRVAYGGRSWFGVVVLPNDKWQPTGVWNRKISRQDGSNDSYELSSDDPRILSSLNCRRAKVDEKGLPQEELSAFRRWLTLYDSYVALESRLRAMQAAALADLERCKKIAGRLEIGGKRI